KDRESQVAAVEFATVTCRNRQSCGLWRSNPLHTGVLGIDRQQPGRMATVSESMKSKRRHARPLSFDVCLRREPAILAIPLLDRAEALHRREKVSSYKPALLTQFVPAGCDRYRQEYKIVDDRSLACKIVRLVAVPAVLRRGMRKL